MPGPQLGSELQQNIGKVFAVLRQAEGLTQKQAGKFAGISQGQVNALELGKGDPKLSSLVKYAEAYGCSIEIVFTMPKEDGDGGSKSLPESLAS